MITADRVHEQSEGYVRKAVGAGLDASGVAANGIESVSTDTLTRILVFSLPLLWAAFAAMMWRPHFNTSDLEHYFTASENAMRGMVPYRDFPFEYPPLALVPMIIPRLLWGGRSLQFPTYVWLFLLENTVFLGLLEYYVIRIARLSNQPRAVKNTVVSLAVLALIATPILPWRIDLFLALVTAAAVAAILENRPGAAGAMIGIGFATKLYPVVLLPVLVARYAAQKDWRSVLRLCGAAAIVAALAVLPFVLRARADIMSFVRYHAQRGLEIESVPAGFVMLGHLWRGLPLAVGINYGALHLRSAAADAVLHWLPAAFPVAIAIVSVAAYKAFARSAPGLDDRSELCDAVLASLLVFIVANKVFSPQYLGWLLPFAPFLRGGRAILMATIFAVTIAIFPFSFDQLVQLRPGAVLLLNARNVLAMGLAVWSTVQLTASKS